MSSITFGMVQMALGRGADMESPEDRAEFWRMWVALERELEAERRRQFEASMQPKTEFVVHPPGASAQGRGRRRVSKHTDQKPPRVWRMREEIVGYESQLIAASRRPTESVELPYLTAKALIEICQQARWVERMREEIVGYEIQLIAASRRPTESVELPYLTAKALIEICQQARWVERMREKHPMSQALRDAQDAYLSMLVAEGR